MTSQGNTKSSCWTDRLAKPTPEALVAEYAKEPLEAWTIARGYLRDTKGVQEELRWLGAPWHWSWVYRGGGEGGELAYLVPETGRARLSLPLGEGALASLAIKKLSRAVREGLARAPEVDGIRWGEWTLESREAWGDVLPLVERALSVLGSRAGG